MEHPEIPKKAQKKIYKKPERKEAIYQSEKNRRENGKYREWQRSNPEKSKLYNELHREHEITEEQWIACKNYFSNENGEWCCAYCGFLQKEHFKRRLGKVSPMDLHKEHVDHIGANDLSNCIPSCQSCNSSKRKADMEDWYRKKPYFSEINLLKIYEWLNDDHKKYLI